MFRHCDQLNRTNTHMYQLHIYYMFITYMSKPAKINYVKAKSCLVFALQTIYTNKTKYLSLLQNLMGYVLQVMEMGYHIQS